MMSSFSVAGNRTLFSLQRENSDTCCNVEEPRGPMLVSCQSLKVSYCRILLMPGSQDSQVHGDREVGKWAERFIWASRVPAEKGAELEGPTWDLGASLLAQLVKNLPAMWETWVRSLGWEDSLEKEKGYLLKYSDLENSMDCIVHGVTKSWTRLSDFYFHYSFK